MSSFSCDPQPLSLSTWMWSLMWITLTAWPVVRLQILMVASWLQEITSSDVMWTPVTWQNNGKFLHSNIWIDSKSYRSS